MNRFLLIPAAFLLASTVNAAAITLTTVYFPESESGSVVDALMRGQFAAILAETREPILHEESGNSYAVRVTAYTVRGAVTFLRIEQKPNGAIVSTHKRYGFTELGVPILSLEVERNLPADAFARLTNEIQQQQFFSLAPADTVATVDAPVCLVEVYNGRTYHSAFRSGCPQGMAFGTVAMRAAEIADVDLFEEN